MPATNLSAISHNCYFALFNNDLVLEFASASFCKLFPVKTSGANTIESFLSSSTEGELENAILNLRTGNSSLESFCTTITIDGYNKLIYWNISPTYRNNLVAGFEALGTVIEESCQETTPVSSDDTNDKWKKIFEVSLDIIFIIAGDGKILKVSPACRKILGYEPSEMVGKEFLNFVYHEDLTKTIQVDKQIKEGQDTTDFNNRYITKQGSIVYLTWSAKWEDTEKIMYCIARDVTDTIKSEEDLRASEEKYRIIFNNHPLPMFIYEVLTFKLLEVNEAAINQYGFTRTEFLDLKVQDLLDKSEIDRFEEMQDQKDFYYKKHRGIWLHNKKNKENFYAEIISNFVQYEGRKAKVVLAKDRTVQILAEKELIKSNEKYVALTKATSDAVWEWDISTGKLSWNEGAEKMFNDNNIEDSIEWWKSHIHPEDIERVNTKLKHHLNNNISKWEDEYRFKTKGDTYIYIYDRGYIMFNSNKEAVRMIGAMQDLTERKTHENMLQKLNISLEKRARELAESNAELERFAYVASHDLQEPLRMVTSFLQLLEKRYKDKLDNKANEYIAYAVDGAERMKRLILDLLEYSKINSSKIELQEVNVDEVVKEVRNIYKTLLNESEGTIKSSTLPIIKGNKTQILQLFQNLIGNALKYRKPEPPVINISYEEDTTNYKFIIADNGIGIDQKFYNKIFIIFQRLHNREQYSGTGLGLAICKKIINKHGGKLWVTSEVGKGSTFYFTIPKSRS